MVHLLVKILFLLLIMPYNIQSYNCNIPGFPICEVHVLNNLPSDSTYGLEVHCASGDNDFGHRFPNVGDDFRWGFCGKPNTLFFCHFWWGNKDLVFDVFNDLNYCVHDGGKIVPQGTTKCIWDVRYDGIYLGYVEGDKTYSQKYRDW
uniref:S-protein homolog n=2 Tax=Solanum TaxID=4107 RepID=M1BRV9_SOLTU